MQIKFGDVFTKQYDKAPTKVTSSPPQAAGHPCNCTHPSGAGFIPALKSGAFARAIVRKAFDERLTLFCANKHHLLLNNHQLLGKYQDCRSINITGDWRAIYRDFDSDETVYFITLGTHSQLYK